MAVTKAIEQVVLMVVWLASVAVAQMDARLAFWTVDDQDLQSVVELVIALVANLASLSDRLKADTEVAWTVESKVHVKVAKKAVQRENLQVEQMVGIQAVVMGLQLEKQQDYNMVEVKAAVQVHFVVVLKAGKLGV